MNEKMGSSQYWILLNTTLNIIDWKNRVVMQIGSKCVSCPHSKSYLTVAHACHGVCDEVRKGLRHLASNIINYPQNLYRVSKKKRLVW